MLRTTTLIKGSVWTVNFITDKTFIKNHGEGHGIALSETKTINIKRSSVSLETILHELWHAYIYESNLESAELTSLQMEEISADTVGTSYHLLGNNLWGIVDYYLRNT